MLKKLMALLMVFSLGLAVVPGCGTPAKDKDKPATPEKDKPAAPAEKDKKP